MSVLRIAWLIARKDLRIEWKSRIITNQVVPFAGVTMVIFGFALDANTDVLELVAPGLVWLATMFSLLLLVQRTFAVEADDGALDAMRVAGVDARGIFFGKAIGLAVQLLVLEVLLLFAAVILYGETIRLDGAVLLVTTMISATCGLAAVGTLYGGLAVGSKGRETLLPLLDASGGCARPHRGDESGRIRPRHRRGGVVGRLAMGQPADGLRCRIRCRWFARLRPADRRIAAIRRKQDT